MGSIQALTTLPWCNSFKLWLTSLSNARQRLLYRYRALLQRNEGLPAGLGARNIGDTSRTLLEKFQRYGWAEGAFLKKDQEDQFAAIEAWIQRIAQTSTKMGAIQQ